MKNKLTTEIVNHFMHNFGVLGQEFLTISSLTSDQFLLDRKLMIEVDKQKVKKNIWGAVGKIDKSLIKIWIADTSVSSNEAEYMMLLQLNDFTLYAINYTADGNEIYGLQQERWIPLTMLLKAKLLVGVEQLTEIFLTWEPMKENIDWFHQQMISFLNFDGENSS